MSVLRDSRALKSWEPRLSPREREARSCTSPSCLGAAPWAELGLGQTRGHLPEQLRGVPVAAAAHSLPNLVCPSPALVPRDVPLLKDFRNFFLWIPAAKPPKYFLALQSAGLKGEFENQAVILRIHLNSSLNSCWTPFSRRSFEASSFQILSDINYCFKRQLCCNKAMSIHSWNWQSANWVSSWSEWLEAECLNCGWKWVEGPRKLVLFVIWMRGLG